MNDNKTTITFGGGWLGLLGVLFVGLKLTNYIDWSWWYVTLPFWGGLALVFGFLTIVFIAMEIMTVISKKTENMDDNGFF